MAKQHSNKIRPGLVLAYRSRSIKVIQKTHGGQHWLCETRPGLTHRMHENKIRKLMLTTA